MENPKIMVTKSSLPPFEEYVEEIRKIWDTAWLTNMGPLHESFAKAVSHYLQVQQISLFTNGHLALSVALRALELQGEVITTPFTFASTTHAIVENGLKPVFCDINPEDFTLDVKKLEDLITEKTAAILPVHVYGSVCDIEAIDRIAKKYDLKVIYDAAHAFGVTIDGRGIGTFGDVSMFSFHATKVFNTIEGGALTYTDERYARIFNEMRNFGISSPETVDRIGTNAKMNEFQAAMGICNLRYVDQEIAKRKRIDERYRAHLQGRQGIRLPILKPGVCPNYAYFPVIFEPAAFGKSRDAVFSDLKEKNIFARKYFYPMMSELGCYKALFSSAATPIAKEISESVLTLPIYADLDLKDVDRICEYIIKA